MAVHKLCTCASVGITVTIAVTTSRVVPPKLCSLVVCCRLVSFVVVCCRLLISVGTQKRQWSIAWMRKRKTIWLHGVTTTVNFNKEGSTKARNETCLGLSCHQLPRRILFTVIDALSSNM